MRLRERRRRYFPNAALIAANCSYIFGKVLAVIATLSNNSTQWLVIAISNIDFVAFSNRISIVVIPLALAQQKNILVRLGAPIPHTLRHRIGLRPDNVLPQ